MAFNRLQTMRDNIEAIRTAFRLGVERRAPNAVEREAFRKYAGFGGLKCILNDADELADAAKWSKSDIELFAPTVELRRLIHDYSHSDKEFTAYMDSLKASVLTAFYTPQPVIDALADALRDNGVKIDKFLEPSAGQGAFVDSFLQRYPAAETLAFEKDLLTGKILSALHPSISTEIKGFEKIDPDFNGYFDVAASNIPFGDFAVADPKYATSREIAFRQSTKAIHNYFFLKALDSVHEGGIVAFIASQGVMNAASPFVRMELMRHADLVGAIRLPNNTFSDNAGTDAGSDLIILQKNTRKEALSADEEFFIQSIVDRENKTPNNKYFAAFPQNVICTTANVGTDQYGKPAIIYKHEGGIEGIAHDLREALGETIKLRLNLELYNSHGVTPPTPDPIKSEKVESENKVTKPQRVAETPLMQQYKEMKKKHPDAILLFRVGDFYECMGVDAVKVSETLGLTLTRRRNGNADSIELAGFPHHALDVYLPKLVRAGNRVAICEQLEDPKQRKTVKRGTPKDEEKPKPEPPKPEQPAPKPSSSKKDDDEPTPQTSPATPPPPTSPTNNAKEIETDGVPDYTNNPDPRLYAYNLFGELEPIGKPSRQRQQNMAKPEEKPKPKIEVDTKPKPTFRKLTKEELDFYGKLDWETNPPINGFYEAMMSIAHRQLAEEAAERARIEAEKAAREAEAAGISTEILTENGATIEKTSGDFVPRPRVAEVEKTVERDMSPRPFSEDIQFFHHNGSMVVDKGEIGFLSEVKKMGATFTPLALKPEQEKRALLYVTMSETYQQLYRYEAETHEESKELRQHLNDYYDEFVDKYGNLNEKQNVKFILMDANGRDALALERGENGVFVKADIFDHPVSFSLDEVTSVETPMEALSASLNKFGAVNLEYMGGLVDKTEDELIDSLKGHIYYNPLVENYETADRFIAGNVVQKASEVKAWIAKEEDRIKNFPGYDGIEPYIEMSKESLKALEDARPRRITFDELDFNFGERWIPTGISMLICILDNK